MTTRNSILVATAAVGYERIEREARDNINWSFFPRVPVPTYERRKGITVTMVYPVGFGPLTRKNAWRFSSATGNWIPDVLV